MDIYQAIQKRYSVRAYKSEAVPEESLNQVLEAGRLAPSAHNAQDYKFVVVKEAEKRKELAEAAAGQSFLAEAPVVIAAVSLNPEDTMSCGVPTYSVNLAIAVDHMTLAAVAEGLGTCWIGAFFQERVKEILGIPAKYKVVVLLPLGYPSDKPKEKSRKDLSELVCFDKFEENS